MVPVEWNGQSGMIDIGIAPLILEIWKAGIYTGNSCEENRPGWVWIQFLHTSGAEDFMSIFGRYEEGIETFYNRIRGVWCHIDGEIPDKWEYDALPFDLAVVKWEEDGYIRESCNVPSQFMFSLSVRFPRSDLPVVLARMREFNSANAVSD